MNDDPTLKITIPKRKKVVQENIVSNFYDKEELQLFFDCLKEEDNDKFLTLFRILALEWRNVNFKENTLTINKTLTRGSNTV